MPFNGHHIWCNGDSRTDPEKCKFCIRLKKLYPEEGVTPDELQKHHFPNVIKRGAPTENNGNQTMKQYL